MIFANAIYKNNSSQSLLGIISNKNMEFVSLNQLYPLINKPIPSTMIELVNNFTDDDFKSMQSLLRNHTFEATSIDDIHLQSPIPYPIRNIMCVGKNYLEHANEIQSIPSGKDQTPQNPIYFTKMSYPTIGPEDIILNHKALTEDLDYEAELVVIIGKKGINISREEAHKYIFGYTIGNDLSVRNIQLRHIQWFKGKSLDTCCAIGPYIVYKDAISFPPKLNIQCTINGDVRQNSNTSKLIFDIPTLINDLSQGMTLYPGDMIMTGTPAGVGYGFKPKRMLKPGDVIECTIQSIGTLRNYVEL